MALGPRLRAALRGRCSRCGEGRIFRGQLTMNEYCPACELKFGREPGYFTGAMYISYFLAVPVLAALTVLFWLVARWDLEWSLLAAMVLFLPTVPAIFRYSRILWIHFDRLTEPED